MTDRYPTPPKNLMEFAHRFATDERCAEYLFELRYPDGYVCPKCGSALNYRVTADGQTHGRCVAAACIKWSNA